MNIYVSNLGDKITDASLDAIFSAHGSVVSSRVIMDGFTPKGFAFVEMPNQQEAMNAIERINGAVIDGRTIEVKQAGTPFQQNNSFNGGK